MQLLHIHWRPPTSPVEPGEVILWTENGLLPAPTRQRGRPSQKPKAHPFDDITASLERVLAASRLAEAASQSTAEEQAAEAQKTHTTYRPRVTGSSGRTSTPSNDCKTPYTIDEKGIKRIKPECL